ncbi:uncharacterized protein PSFLO_07335 [Pseudozyma flocculosa]|uniref:Uncharacterized protein n=1 Tax=Pseudozyma flocculosa TaxID=84751 RepID=A0A5C3FBP1_9BASI|nr:uncharacterized protein PSFLO_07335 [Pseudozyma flocculosa]
MFLARWLAGWLAGWQAGSVGHDQTTHANQRRRRTQGLATSTGVAWLVLHGASLLAGVSSDWSAGGSFVATILDCSRPIEGRDMLRSDPVARPANRPDQGSPRSTPVATSRMDGLACDAMPCCLAGPERGPLASKQQLGQQLISKLNIGCSPDSRPSSRCLGLQAGFSPFVTARLGRMRGEDTSQRRKWGQAGTERRVALILPPAQPTTSSEGAMSAFSFDQAMPYGRTYIYRIVSRPQTKASHGTVQYSTRQARLQAGRQREASLRLDISNLPKKGSVVAVQVEPSKSRSQQAGGWIDDADADERSLPPPAFCALRSASMPSSDGQPTDRALSAGESKSEQDQAGLGEDSKQGIPAYGTGGRARAVGRGWASARSEADVTRFIFDGPSASSRPK